MRLVRSDGSRLSGTQFIADLLTRELRFDGGASGSLTYQGSDGEAEE